MAALILLSSACLIFAETALGKLAWDTAGAVWTLPGAKRRYEAGTSTKNKPLLGGHGGQTENAPAGGKNNSDENKKIQLWAPLRAVQEPELRLFSGNVATTLTGEVRTQGPSNQDQLAADDSISHRCATAA